MQEAWQLGRCGTATSVTIGKGNPPLTWQGKHLQEVVVILTHTEVSSLRPMNNDTGSRPDPSVGAVIQSRHGGRRTPFTANNQRDKTGWL